VDSADCQSAIQQVDNVRHKAEKFGQHARNEVRRWRALSWVWWFNCPPQEFDEGKNL